MTWTKHPSINQAWLCEQLYGNKSDSRRSQLSKKIRGKLQWTADELGKLEAIRAQLLKELSE